MSRAVLPVEFCSSHWKNLPTIAHSDLRITILVTAYSLLGQGLTGLINVIIKHRNQSCFFFCFYLFLSAAVGADARAMPPPSATMPLPSTTLAPPSATLPRPPATLPQPPATMTSAVTSFTLGGPRAPAELPSHWKDHLPTFQQEWISHTVFRPNAKTGKAELVDQLKLWWHPPQPPLIHTQPPASANLFFCRPLCLWMPYKMWRYPLVCVRPACDKYRLTGAGLYRTVRRVLDIDGWYDLATEYLECKRCSKKYPAWSEDMLGQLDMGHRSQFPALLTYR